MSAAGKALILCGGWKETAFMRFVKTTQAEAQVAEEEAMLPEAEAPLCLRLFGAGEIIARGVPSPRPKQRKDYLLLALLALRAGQMLERDWLAGALWPDSEASQALYNLRRSLSAARRALGEEGGRIELPRAVRYGSTRQERMWTRCCSTG